MHFSGVLVCFERGRFGGLAKISAFVNVAGFAVFWENLLNPKIQAGFRAGLHFWFFNDLGAVLHVDAWPSALVFVYRVAHAQAAPPTGLVRLDT